VQRRRHLLIFDLLQTNPIPPQHQKLDITNHKELFS
jgi:hypothetical protein